MSASTGHDDPILPAVLESFIRQKRPLLWLNENWSPLQQQDGRGTLGLADVHKAASQLQRFASLLERLFPELEPSGGIIESPLHDADALQRLLIATSHCQGRWLLKSDHALPIAGSIKARGGVFEVLLHAQNVAHDAGIIGHADDPLVLASSVARALFAQHRVLVGSTGNLGMSIGVMAAALGFRAIVHMSAEAKEWKKVRLRERGVRVVEHEGDYGSAVAAGREEAASDSKAYFVDDENSRWLFLGYSVAALRLQQQLHERGITVDAQHPLLVYLPCGVGGAPGGITFGLRHCFGDSVHCFLAEPVASPCMLLRLASLCNAPVSVGDVGLDNCTEADGLAVGKASEFAAGSMRTLVSGVFTVPDVHLLQDLYILERSMGLRIEPSAAAGFRGPRWLLQSAAGRRYLGAHDLLHRVEDATHVLWTTGGSLLPEDEYWGFHERGRAALLAGNAA